MQPTDLLGALIEMGPETESDVVDQCFTFLRAGHDTTSATIQWVLLELAQRPAELKKCQVAIDAIMGKRESAIAEGIGDEQISSLLSSYLHLVVKETMRLHPALPIFGRVTADAVEMGPFFLPANTNVAVAAMALHYDPEWWDQPFDFVPDRWTKPLKHPFQYIPFSSGPRSCIGSRFAQLEMISVLALILRRFDVAINPKDLSQVRPTEAILLTPMNVILTVTRRSLEVTEMYADIPVFDLAR
jgi:cytochrome P450